MACMKALMIEIEEDEYLYAISQPSYYDNLYEVSLRNLINQLKGDK